MKKSKSNREEKMSEIQERLMKGTKEIYESGKWAEYISVMSKFPNYSINNCILIASQCPHASYVCGYKKWNEFNRNVVKGESGIMIFAPIKGKVEVEEPKFDERNQPVLNDDAVLNELMFKMIASKGILFTGKGASGKTTLMNAMIAEIPHDESVMICQENAELFDKNHPDLFAAHVLTNSGDSKISYELGDLTRAALLVDLDRVIVGEVKEGQEAAGLSKASMTGHKCWTSVHGESCEMAVDKMADYISQATGYSTRDSLKQLQGFEYVVHLKDFHVDEIVRIAGWDKERETLIYEKVYPVVKEGV